MKSAYIKISVCVYYGVTLCVHTLITIAINSHAKAPHVSVYNLTTFSCIYSLSYMSNLQPLLKSCAIVYADDKCLKRGKI